MTKDLTVSRKPSIGMNVAEFRELLYTQGQMISRSLSVLASIELALHNQASNERTIRELRAAQLARPVSVGRDFRPLVRRLFHSLNRLHPICKVHGCQYCELRKDVLGVIEAHFLMSTNEVRK